MPKALSQPIVFEPSARLNGAVIIHASRLKSDVTYTVECEDYRGEVGLLIDIPFFNNLFPSYFRSCDHYLMKKWNPLKQHLIRMMQMVMA